MMRIITGKARGIRLETLEGEATRPTSERAKEALFSMIQFELEGREVLDLFGGSGQLGLEALSRGALHATICDRSKQAVSVITKNAEKTKLAPDCRIICADWEEVLRRYERRAKFDIVFLDPPYAERLIPKVLSKLLPMLKPTSIVVCESAEPDVFAKSGMEEKFETVKSAKYGIAYINILKLKGEEQ